jgi:hypothetical protein
MFVRFSTAFVIFVDTSALRSVGGSSALFSAVLVPVLFYSFDQLQYVDYSTRII